MDWMKKKPAPQTGPQTEPQADSGIQPANHLERLDAADVYMPPRIARKPSERFMRKSLEAKSRASQSERFKLATLKEALKAKSSDTTNEASVFNGYCPGREKLPG